MNIKTVFNQNGKSLQEIMFQNIQQIIDTGTYNTPLNTDSSDSKLEYIQKERVAYPKLT